MRRLGVDAYLVALNLDPKGSVSKANSVTYGRTEHSHVRIATDIRVLGDLEGTGFRSVPKALLYEVPHNLFCARQVDDAARKTVATSDYLCACDRAERHCLCVARLEPNCCARGDVEALSVGLSAVEDECGIRLDEVVMRSNLSMKPVQKSMLHSKGDGGPEALWLLASAN